MPTTPQTVLITGAGGGLGKAIATAFLTAGANVAICDVNTTRLESTTAEWTAAGHANTRFLATVADVTDATSVAKFLADALAQFGRLDVLVNNAGLLDDFSGVGECTRTMWDRVLNVNLLGPYLLSQAAIKQFSSQGEGAGGIIINICSSAALRGHMAGAAYTASKHGLLGLSKNTAVQYGDQGIYSIALVLGGMDTNVSDGMKRGDIDPAAYARITGTVMPFDGARHLVPLESVAKYVLFLSERDIARSANGSTVNFRNNWPVE